MTTFSQSEIIEASCTLAISTFPSTTSVATIKDEVTKVLIQVLQNPMKPKTERPTGWRLRATRHTASLKIFEAMKTPLPFTVQNLMTSSIIKDYIKT